MWFKRRKHPEQDHALSESLRSLQNLLSETDRREPSLDSGHSSGDEVEEPAAPGRAPATHAASRNGPDSRDSGPREAVPEAPGGSGNRWRDLSLSFDAEPVIPRARRDSGAEEKRADEGPAVEPQEPVDEAATDPLEEEAAGLSEPPEAPRVPADQAATGLDEEEPADRTAVEAAATELPAGEPAPEPASPSDAGLPGEGPEPDDGPQASEPDEPEMVTYDVGAKPVPPPPYRDDAVQDLGPPTDPGALGGETPAGESGPPDYHTHSSPDDAVLVLDLDEAEGPSPEPVNEDEDAESFDPGRADPEARAAAAEPSPAEPVEAAGTAEPAEHAESPAAAPEEAAPGEAPAAPPDGPQIAPEETGSDERGEDQLHLELDPGAASQADIPVLTNAVYVPEPPPEAPGPAPGPSESPHEQPIGRCIDNLRVRLQLMGLETLSSEQEKALHDALVEFLDELDHD